MEALKNLLTKFDGCEIQQITDTFYQYLEENGATAKEVENAEINFDIDYLGGWATIAEVKYSLNGIDYKGEINL